MKTISNKLPGFVALIVLFSICAHAQENDKCLECHERGSSKSRLHISGAEFKSSVHGKEVSCVECHPGAEQDAHMKSAKVTPVNCAECHSETKNVHAPKGHPKAPACHTCHGKHGIFPHTDPRSTLARSHIHRTCERCHPEKITQGGLTWVYTVRIKGHGKAYMGHEYLRTWCLDCHQGQAGHEGTEPVTDKDCSRCHGPDVQRPVFLGSFHGSGGGTGGSGDVLYAAGLLVAVGLFCLGWIRQVRMWRKGRPEARWDRPLTRLRGWFGIVFRQKRIIRRPLAGWSHYFLFAGVSLPLLVVFITQWEFRVSAVPSAALSILLDIAGLGLLVGVALACYRRLRHPDEFPHGQSTEFMVLVLLACVAVTGFLAEGLRISTTGSSSWISPVGAVFAQILPASGAATALTWRFHFFLVLAFLALIPFTRLRHMVTASLNAYFRDLTPRGQLPSVDVESGNRFGVSSVFDLTWKGLLDTDACLSCGRCQEVCPAYRAEKPLSPMKVVRDIKKEAVECTRDASKREKMLSHARDHWIGTEEIWACTTCQACQEACPVLVEHVDKIVGLRRGLVLNDGQAPKEAVTVLRNLQIFGDPEGYGAAHRRDWIPSGHGQDLNQPGTVVLWVGCRGAAHPRAAEIARTLLSLADRAGESVLLLGERELCCGDPARRLGAEDIFQDLAHSNIALLRDLGASTIVAFCPHCYNTLANEYPDFGGNFTVLSSTEWAASLLEAEKLVVRRSWPKRVAYHDPCYLGRINGQVEGPRSILRAVPGLDLLEPAHSGMETFCCGAGGGRSWLHESGVRINQLRTEQCMDTHAEHIATACPYCVVMLEDGLTGLAEDRREPARVFDVMEILEWVTR